MSPNDLPVTPDLSSIEPRSTGMGLVRRAPPNRRWFLAARLLVEQDLSNKAVCAQVGIADTTLDAWKRKPEFIRIMDAYRNRLQALVFAEGIAQKVNRVQKLNRLANRLETIIVERAIEFRAAHADALLEHSNAEAIAYAAKDLQALQRLGPAPRPVAGADSGLIVHTRKGAGSGDAAEVNSEFPFDSALHKAYLDTLEKAQKEMGDFYSRPSEDAKSGPGGSGNVQVNINFPVLSPEQIAEIDNAQVIDLPPQMRRLIQRPSDGMPR